MSALTAPCSANCVVSTKNIRSACKQVCILAIETWYLRPSGSALVILIVSTGVNRRDFRAESCRWISMQTVAPFLPKVCNFMNHEKSGKISAPVWRRRTNRRSCCPPMSNPSTAWPDSAGRWDNRMAAQLLPWDLAKQWLEGLARKKEVLQHDAKQDLILVSKKKIWYSCNLDVFCGKGMAIPQIKFGFFLAFKQSVWPVFGLFIVLFGFLLKFSSDNPGPSWQPIIFCVIRFS